MPSQAIEYGLKMFKLKWTVAKDPDGSFVRRRLENDMFGVDYIDVEWTHANGFPHDTETIPFTHPPRIKYEQRKVLPVREVIKDQVIVTPNVPDSTVAMMLDEKRIVLAKALNIEP